MNKPYNLDYTVERDTDRTAIVADIIDKLDQDLSAYDLETLASYILYGKDENGKNSIQRNETTAPNTRYKTYRKKEDTVKSLDEIMENPVFNEQSIRSAYQRDVYVSTKPTIHHPRYDKVTGELIDPGDSDIPGMVDLWDTIARWQRAIDVARGRAIGNERDTYVNNYQLYKMRHHLIDIRKQQYYLKEAYKPEIHFQNIDHPKVQFYDWSGDAYYWCSRAEWQYKVDHAYTSRVSKNLDDYETRGEGDQLEVKWVVRRHNFDWENPQHVRAFMNNYLLLYEALHDKIDTYGRTLFWDFDRYVELCHFDDTRLDIIEMRKKGLQFTEIMQNIRSKLEGIRYAPNYVTQILTYEIPNRISRCAKMQRLEISTPLEEKKKCCRCGTYLPADPLYFTRNHAHEDGFSSVCKTCERKRRIEKGVIPLVDRRRKDKTMRKMQAGKEY